ncbi:22151_t:CDS:2, partial [Racocetra persica]
HKKEGISLTPKKKIVLSALNAPTLTSAVSEERQRHQTSDRTRKKHIFLGKIPDDEEPEAPIEEQFILRLLVPEDVSERK